MSHIIDLSINIENNMPFYPGDPKPLIRPALTLDDDGCRVTVLNIGSHTGTHMDAPSHFMPHGKTINEISLEQCMGRALVSDLTNLAPLTKIMPEHCTNLDRIYDNDIEIFILHTNWTNKAGTDEFYLHPYLSEELCDCLISANIKAVGVDMLNVDKTETDEVLYEEGSVAAHNKLLGNDIIIVENLCNLDSLSTDTPFVTFAPLKIIGADGSPVRAYAIENDL